MKRNLKRLADERFDLLVIGGGITGAAVAWDAALRGLSVALVERRDFGGATSAATGKLIHGGLRYLKNFELSIVRESLRERRIMEFIAPHQVSPMPFVIPTYGKEALLLKAGLSLYDMLGYDRGRLADPEKRISGHKRLSKKQVLDFYPGLPEKGLTGGFQYYDCHMVAPERLTFDFIRSAADKGAVAANWAGVIGFRVEKATIKAALLRDEPTGEELEVAADCFVNATGCWADRLLGLVSGESESRISRSKGIHIVFRGLHPTHSLGMITRSRRHVYLVSWKGLTLAGTTDTSFTDAPDNLSVTEKEIEDFVGELNACYPALELTMDDVISSYGGLRPLADTDGAKDSYDASRKHEVIDHESEGLAKNLISALGGKYTTSRGLAQQIVDHVFKKMGKRPAKCRTASTPLAGAPEGRMAAFREDARAGVDMEAELVDHLIAHYGTDWEKVAEFAWKDPELKGRFRDSAWEIAAQIAYAAANECAVHLEDAVFRRTDLCNLGHPGRDALMKCAGIMGNMLGWPADRRNEEIVRVEEIFKKRRA